MLTRVIQSHELIAAAFTHGPVKNRRAKDASGLILVRLDTNLARLSHPGFVIDERPLMNGVNKQIRGEDDVASKIEEDSGSCVASIANDRFQRNTLGSL
ncbi:hypothetical protein AAE478_005895 [Parahypoxylon ruwenzoriense]